MKDYTIIKEKLSAEYINTLIDLKLIIGDKMEYCEL